MFSATRLSVLVCLVLGLAVNAAPAGAEANTDVAGTLNMPSLLAGSAPMSAEDATRVLANLGLAGNEDSHLEARQTLASLGLGANFSLNDLLSALGFFNTNNLFTTTSNGVVVTATSTGTTTATATATNTFTGTSITLPTITATATGTSVTATATATVGVNNNNGLNALLSSLFGGNGNFNFGNSGFGAGANANAGANTNLNGIDLSQFGF